LTHFTFLKREKHKSKKKIYGENALTKQTPANCFRQFRDENFDVKDAFLVSLL